MADLLCAFLHNRSFSLQDISSGLSGECSTKHKLKRLVYFLDSIELDLQFWKSFALAVFSLPGFRFKSRKVLTLALDATTLRDDFWILAITVSFNGRGIPIYLRGWEGVNVNYDYWDRVRGVLTDLKELLPRRYRYEIVADRGFQGDAMFGMCKELGIDFIVRINDSYTVKLPNGTEYVQLSLFNEGYYRTEHLGQKERTPGINVAVASKAGPDGKVAKWYLATGRDLGHGPMVEKYTTRFWIEEQFKDMKSKLKWEGYTKKVPRKGRLLKCVAASSLSYAVQTAIGNQLRMSGSERKRTSLFNKFRQTVRRGTQELEEIILKFLNMIGTYIKRARYDFC